MDIFTKRNIDGDSFFAGFSLKFDLICNEHQTMAFKAKSYTQGCQILHILDKEGIMREGCNKSSLI